MRGYDPESRTNKQSTSSSSQATGDIGVELRVGKRFNIGSFNYFSAGAFAQTELFAVTSGVQSNGHYLAGPYIGFQRHFSGTNLMLTLYVLPVNYTYTPAFQGVASTQGWQFFQTGAFGLAYLF